MPQGIQLWNAAGQQIVDFSTRTGFVLGRIDIASGNQSGTQVDSAFADGTPFYFFLMLGDQGQLTPEVSFSGTTMTWTSVGMGTFSGSLFYGVW